MTKINVRRKAVYPAIAEAKTAPAEAKAKKSKRQARVELVPPSLLPAPAGRFVALAPDKLRGGYYTPAPVAEWLACWALRSPWDTFLEPSCGDGAILKAGVSRLLDLGAKKRQISRLVQGVEVTPNEADAARAVMENLAGKGARDTIETGDFFAWFRALGERRFSAVLGNPPFIRYQSFPEPARGRAMAIMDSLGFRSNKLTRVQTHNTHQMTAATSGLLPVLLTVGYAPPAFSSNCAGLI